MKQEKLILKDENTNKEIGFVLYEVDEERKVLTILSTQVHQEYQGQGKAKILMENIVKFAVERGYKIESFCSYATNYLSKNSL